MKPFHIQGINLATIWDCFKGLELIAKLTKENNQLANKMGSTSEKYLVDTVHLFLFTINIS